MAENNALKKAYESHDLDGIAGFLETHKTEGGYRGLYGDYVKSGKDPEKAYDAVGDYLKRKKSPAVREPQQKISKDYEFEIFWPGSENYNPEEESVDLVIRSGGREYTGTVLTPGFIDAMFEKNRRTGECAGGSYFCIPRMVVVKRIDNETIKRTLDEMIDNGEIDIYFK